ncbi:MAG: endonuclease III domain-containing protein [Candidatus Pacebacteria bacterium]|nr:endonuclease III domain-containing protein [Candidatus Paceibacterota bacterium]
MNLYGVYKKLFATYGAQGWWPLTACGATGAAESVSSHGYHPEDYTFPHNDRQRYEICLGAILTQNTAWVNAEQALMRLHSLKSLSPKTILHLAPHTLIWAVQPSGYYNVKAKKLRCFTRFWMTLQGTEPTRNQLLDVWGIGPETADSILLYAYGRHEMVVDAYTRRILAHLRFLPANCSYDQMKAFCTQHLPCDVPLYQEFHALIVEHAKHYYRRNPYTDPVLLPRNAGKNG